MISFVVIYMSYSGPIILGRYTDRGLCEIVASEESALCAIAVRSE